MPTYVTLLNYSAEGFKELSEERRQQQINLIESQGGRVIGAYGLMGEWDVMLITEFPNEKSAMRALLNTCQSGMGTTQTMTALPWEEFVQLGQHP
ncbi:MAG: GYD domain-containing protein [Candidatus Tectomicrobia bacterium]|nr:GYD domain-containing protein [Candidatus Tectomicrobia bacterium]